jgi:hypothetical protein
MEKRRFAHEFALVLLLALAIGAIALHSSINPTNPFTGFVVGPTGEQCDGTWTCGDWATCTEGNQTRECTSTDSLNCTSPITESQTCIVENISTCTESWTCVDWATCTEGNQTRTCTDANSCGTTTSKPSESQTCTVACAESWTCGDWATCSSNSQTRTCTDANSCGTTTSKPSESQTCTVACAESWTCGNWSDCANGNQTRTCTDANSCGTTTSKPIIIDSCVSAVTTTTQTTDTTSITCIPNWQCGDWQECVSGNQARACTDTNNCGTQDGIPSTSQACTVPIVETCSDKIKNQDETGIDCGGVCKKCGIFTIVGSAISGPIGSIGTSMQKIFSNKTNIFIASGALAFVVCGFFAFKFFRKHKLKVIKQ